MKRAQSLVLAITVSASGRYSPTPSTVVKRTTQLLPAPMTLIDQQMISEVLNARVSKLHLSWNSIDNRGAQIISRFLLDEACAIEEISLCLNIIGMRGAKLLFDAIQSNRSLKRINLIAAFRVNPSGCWIPEALRSNSCLQEMDLSQNKLMASGAEYLEEALTLNSSLKKLGLKSNDISDEGVRCIARGLLFNSSLTELNLSSNGITAHGADHLAKALIRNSTLQYIDLSDNYLRSQGAETIAIALKLNTAVKKLRLDSNIVVSRGRSLDRMCDNLKTKVFLTELNLGGNRIRDTGAIWIGSALRENSVLQVLTLSDNEIKS